MAAILDQLELNQTFFYQLGIFVVLYFFLSAVYFKPFLKLFQLRHKKTVEDREAAEKLAAQATSKLDEYQRRIAEERLAARAEIDRAVDAAKKEEAEILGKARADAKSITQGTITAIRNDKEQIRKKLEADVESLARTIADSLLLRKA